MPQNIIPDSEPFARKYDVNFPLMKDKNSGLMKITAQGW